MDRQSVARALAWFGVGLGVAEVLAARTVARASGLEGREGVIRAFGVREIASGVLILAAKAPASRLWLRTAGDALDTALLTTAMTSKATSGRALLATLAVLPVVALDALYTFAPDALDNQASAKR